jgi:uncharacterized paraquat-inducible protein A
MRWRKADRERRKAEDELAVAEAVAEYDRRKAAAEARRTQQAADREQERREGLPQLPGDDQGPVCTRCHGRQFEARREAGKTTAVVLTAGIGGLLVPRNVVECVTCGMRYRRG